MTKHKRFSHIRDLTVSRAMLSAGWGILIILLIILLFSYIPTVIDVPEPVVSVITAAALCIGAYSAGYICARRNKKNGLLMGIICGGIIFLVLFTVSIIFAGSTEGLSGGAKLFMVLLCGAVGGIIGVNGKNNRY